MYGKASTNVAARSAAALFVTVMDTSLCRWSGSSARWFSSPSGSWVQPHCGEAGGLGQSEGSVGGLHGSSRGAFGEVVDGTDGDDRVGPRVEPRRDVSNVAAHRRLGRW